jgi:hypothetical protein
MGMLTTNLRPIMLGLLIKPGDWRGLVDAIETASAFWGGAFFPIIASRRRISGTMRLEMPRRVSATQMLSGYMDAFDPDIIVPFNGVTVSVAVAGPREIIDSKKLFERFSDDGTPRFGIGAPEVISDFIAKELKYVRKQPLRIVLPRLTTEYRPFLASVFGQLPHEIDVAARGLFPAEADIETPECSIENFADFFEPQTLFLRRLMSLHLNIRLTEACLYFLNAGIADDIADYWNLRAAGWSVLPVPEQACDNKAIKQLATDFINENYWAHRYNPDFYHHTNVIKGRNASARALVKFINSLSLEPPKATHSPRITIIPTYPRIWDEWAREKDAVEVHRVYSSKSEADIPEDVEKIEFVPVAPKFAHRFAGHGSPRFANDIEIRFYGRADPIAEVIPSGDKRLIRAIGAYSFEHWRFSRNGMSYPCEYPGLTVHLSPPRAERVFSEWLRCEGWDVELSDKGYIAAQMVKRLGGIWGIGVLASRGLIALLKKMTAARSTVGTMVAGVDADASTEPSGKIVKAKTFIGEIAKFCSAEGTRQPDDYLRRLLELQMFRLGVEVQCPTCRQRWWESLKQLDYQLTCPNCFEAFPVASWLPKDFDWAFRTVGPFSLPDSAFGVYAVLLTLRFFPSYCGEHQLHF